MSEKTLSSLRQMLMDLPIQANANKMQAWLDDHFNGGDHVTGLSLEEALEKFHPVDIARIYPNQERHCLVYTYTESKTEYTDVVWRSDEGEYNYFYRYEFLD